MSNTTELSLKPCPFCGGDAEYIEERIYRIPFNNLSWRGVKCRNCGGAYIDTDTHHCAIDVYEAWNKRTFGMTVNQYGGNCKCFGHVENLTILIKALRNCSDGMCSLCPYDDHEISTKGCTANLMRDAADSIEQLNNLLDLNTQRCEALRGQLRDSNESYEKHLNEIESQVPRWIPVTERLPEEFQKVLVFWHERSEPMIDTAFWQKEAKRFDGEHWVRMEDKVTHWMPLPKAPDLTGAEKCDNVEVEE